MKELGPYHSAILTGGKVKTLLRRVLNNGIMLMLIVNMVNEDKPEQVLLSEVTEDMVVEQVLLVNGEHVNVNNANVEQVLIVDGDCVDVNTETGENANRDGDTETLENADVNNGNEAGNVDKTKVSSIEDLVCTTTCP